MEKSLTIKIKKWGINGEGIGYIDRKPIFVQGVLPDELVEVEIEKEVEKYYKGKLIQVIEESPRRRHAICPIWKECGGCSLMHVQYKEQCKMKEQSLKETLIKYAGYKKRINPFMKNTNPLGYRNACKLPFGYADGKIMTGMYERESNHFIGMEHCIVHSKVLETTRKQIVESCQKHKCKVYDKRLESGFQTLVCKEFNGNIQVIFVTGKNTLSDEFIDDILDIEPVTSIWQSIKVKDSIDVFGDTMIHIAGDRNLTVEMHDMKFNILPKSFFQLNTEQADKLYTYVESILPESKTVIEAYSGIGAISLYIKDKAQSIIGIESIKDAVDNANENAAINHADHVHFICGDAAKECEKIVKKKKVDTLIVDPPRSGLDENMKETILNSKIRNIIYISCNPSTLSKDLDKLQKRYNILSVQPIDMFSQTQHVETVVLLTKVQN